MLFGLLSLILGFGYVVILVFCLFRLVNGFLNKNKTYVKQAGFVLLFLVGVPILLKLWTFTVRPNGEDLVGKYILVKSYSGISKKEFSNYILDLANDGTFTLTKNEGLGLCKNGSYELDYNFSDNELSFLCEGGYQLASIEQGLFSFQIGIGFASGVRSDYFEKVK